MQKKYIVIIIIAICMLITLICKIDNKQNNQKLGSYNFVKDTISNEKEWNEKNINEQFSELKYRNSIYLSTDMKINNDDIKKKIDITNILGSEDFEAMHKKQITIYSIKDISVNYAVAVKFENDVNYYVYINPKKADDSNNDSTIYKYDKSTDTTTPVEITKTNKDSSSSGSNPIK